MDTISRCQARSDAGLDQRYSAQAGKYRRARVSFTHQVPHNYSKHERHRSHSSAKKIWKQSFSLRKSSFGPCISVPLSASNMRGAAEIDEVSEIGIYAHPATNFVQAFCLRRTASRISSGSTWMILTVMSCCSHELQPNEDA